MVKDDLVILVIMMTLHLQLQYASSALVNYSEINENQSMETAKTGTQIPPLVSLRYSTLPIFHIKPLFYNDSKCKELDTTNCIASSNSNFCYFKIVHVICSENATEPEISLSMDKLGRMAKHNPVMLEINANRFHLTPEMFEPVKHRIIALEFKNFSNMNMHEFRNLSLPNLSGLSINNGLNLQISTGDLDGFPKLRSLFFGTASFTFIEEGSFDNLHALKLLSFEDDWDPRDRKQLWNLHCNCSYFWLRRFFGYRPYLLKERQEGEVYSILETYSSAATRHDIFVPVDCSKPDLIGSPEQTSFSVNDNCCTFNLQLIGSNFSNRSSSKSGRSASCFPAKSEILTDPDLDPELYSVAQIDAANYVRWVIYPILLIICTVGNGLALFVLINEKPKGGANAYLFTVSICSLFAMWLELPECLNDYLKPDLENTTASAYPRFAQAYLQYEGLNKWGQLTTIQLADWILVIFSIERLVAGLVPLAFRATYNPKISWILCGTLLGLSATSYVYWIVEYYIYEYQHIYDVSQKPIKIVLWGRIQDRAQAIIPVFTFVVLLATNMLNIAVLERQRKTFANKMKKDNAEHQFKSSYMLLVGSVVLYLVTHTPIVVNDCLLIEDSKGQYDYLWPTRLFAFPFIRMCFYINYSANCYVYLLVSKRFRQQLATLLRKHGCLATSGSGQRSTPKNRTTGRSERQLTIVLKRL